MDITLLIGGLIATGIRVYPEMRLVRYLLSKLNVEGKAKIIITSFIVLLFDMMLLAVFNYSSKQFLDFTAFDLLTLTFFSYKDYRPNALLNRIIAHISFKIIFGILFFPVMAAMCIAFLPLLGVTDKYYILTLITSFIYCYFGLWRSKNKRTPEGVTASM